jgi:hypothetical protein
VEPGSHSKDETCYTKPSFVTDINKNKLSGFFDGNRQRMHKRWDFTHQVVRTVCSKTKRVNMVLLRLQRPNAVVRVWLVHEFKWRKHAVTERRIPRATSREVRLKFKSKARHYVFVAWCESAWGAAWALDLARPSCRCTLQLPSRCEPIF